MIPKFNQTMLPILEAISDEKEYSLPEMVDILTPVFKVSEEELKETSSNGASLFYNKVGWWKSYLKQAGLIQYPKRGYFTITDEWKKVLSEWLTEITVKYLKKYPSFLAFIAPSNKKDTQSTNEETDTEELSPTDLIERWYEKYLHALKTTLLDQLKETDPYYFEKIILILFQKMGYGDFEETKKSGDGWIDGIINQDTLGIERIYTQAKRYTTANVWEWDIRNFIGAMSWDVSKWIFVTTSDFDKKALEKVRDARNHKIILINGERLVELMIKYNVWIQETSNNYIIKEIDWDFFE